MPKWHGLDFGKRNPQELETTKKVHTSPISSIDPGLQIIVSNVLHSMCYTNCKAIYISGPIEC